MAEWCRHYNGIGGTIYEPGLNDGRACRAGVRYLDVMDGEAHGLARFPCFEDVPSNAVCASLSFLTAQEKADRQRRHEEYLLQWAADMEANVCPECKQPMTKQQIGRCVYASPCGHRLYQGWL